MPGALPSPRGWGFIHPARLDAAVDKNPTRRTLLTLSELPGRGDDVCRGRARASHRHRNLQFATEFVTFLPSMALSTPGTCSSLYVPDFVDVTPSAQLPEPERRFIRGSAPVPCSMPCQLSMLALRPLPPSPPPHISSRGHRHLLGDGYHSLLRSLAASRLICFQSGLHPAARTILRQLLPSLRDSFTACGAESTLPRLRALMHLDCAAGLSRLLSLPPPCAASKMVPVSLRLPHLRGGVHFPTPWIRARLVTRFDPQNVAEVMQHLRVRSRSFRVHCWNTKAPAEARAGLRRTW